MKQLEGRVVVVTGAGSGIGRATSEALAAEGCHLALVDVSQERLDEVRRALADGRRVSTHLADVSDRGRMAALPAEVVAEHGAVHVVVNNAGITVGRSFEEHEFDDLDRVIGIDFWGVVHGCKFFLPHLREVDEAHIVNVSSMAAFMGLPMQSSYCAAKFAVHGLSEALYCELAGSGIGVTSVHPGTIRTRILEDASYVDPDSMGGLADGMARFGRPPEAVARKIVRAIRRRRTRVRVGPDAYLTDWLRRGLPHASLRLLAAASRRIL